MGQLSQLLLGHVCCGAQFFDPGFHSTLHGMKVTSCEVFFMLQDNQEKVKKNVLSWAGRPLTRGEGRATILLE